MTSIACYILHSILKQQGEDDSSAERQLYRINKAIEKHNQNNEDWWELSDNHKYIEATYPAGDESQYHYQWHRILKDAKKEQKKNTI